MRLEPTTAIREVLMISYCNNFTSQEYLVLIAV